MYVVEIKMIMLGRKYI